jgi:putative transcriptional regulator
MDSSLPKYFGAKVKENRIRMGLTQIHLAQITGLTRVSIINMESGRHSPTLNGLMILCSCFGCQPNDLLPRVKKKQLQVKEKRVRIVKVKTYKTFKFI